MGKKKSAVNEIEKIEGVVYATGWDDCLVGHGSIYHGSDGPKIVAIYDRTKMVSRMAAEMSDDHMEIGARSSELNEETFFSDADEYISFNVEGAFIRLGMPVFASFTNPVRVVCEHGCLCEK